MVSLGGESAAFPSGSFVSFKTVNNLRHEGQVICFDPSIKVLVLRDKDPVNGQPLMRFFNLSLISEIKETSPPKDVETIENILASCHMNAKKTNERIKTALSLRVQELMPVDNISLDGQRAFLQIRRTIGDTCWEGEDIRVLGLVTVKKPYTRDSVELVKSEISSDSDDNKAKIAMDQVKKILSKPYTAIERKRPDFSAPSPISN